MDKLSEILKFAIDREIEAAEFYRNLKERISNVPAKTMLDEFEKMELSHADLLKTMDINQVSNYNQQKVNNLKLSDYMVEPVLHEESSFQDILVVAMIREEAAAKLYSELSNQAENTNVKNLFLKLADEELKHKLSLETLYDEKINYEF